MLGIASTKGTVNELMPRLRQAVALALVMVPGTAWGVLVYLAGDTKQGHRPLQHDLGEILKVGGSDELMVVVQHDGPAGATRYIVPPPPSAPDLPPTQVVGRVDSGRTAAN